MLPTLPHCDLRRPNILVEGSKVWLIDFSQQLLTVISVSMTRCMRKGACVICSSLAGKTKMRSSCKSALSNSIIHSDLVQASVNCRFEGLLQHGDVQVATARCGKVL